MRSYEVRESRWDASCIRVMHALFNLASEKLIDEERESPSNMRMGVCNVVALFFNTIIASLSERQDILHPLAPNENLKMT